MTLHSLGIDKLSIPERLELLGELWDSIAEHPEQVPVSEAQRDDLERRLNEYEADPSNVLPWTEVRVRLRGGS